jgi:hypothetical protein|tara:strand:+ start:2533 stop:2973 length:441 start_codon:yes stop_codon:yes gene_type:complete
MNKKQIITIDFILVIGTIIVVASLIKYSEPFIVAPISNTKNTNILFEFEKTNLILVSQDVNFKSIKEIHPKDNLMINLKPGKYYWEFVNISDNEIKEFSILSKVDLKFVDKDDKFEVVNVGDTKLNVKLYNHGEFTGNIILNTENE